MPNPLAENSVDTPPGATRPPIRILHWRTVLAGAIFALIVTATVTTWLWTLSGNDANLRIEAIKTGFTVGFGVGGAFALFLAARRQRLMERIQIHQEDIAASTQAHQERVAAANEHDAAERRVTELYIKAVDQLGSAHAPVRLGGFYALERLAQANPDHRQTVIDVICAYLRMPFVPPNDAGANRPSTSNTEEPESTATSPQQSLPDQEGLTRGREELQVRVTAQRLLAAHLTPGPRPETLQANARRLEAAAAGFWAGIRLDLTGATLYNFDLRACRLQETTFTHATFIGISHFNGVIFDDVVSFEYATFHDDVVFYKATFRGDAKFSGAVFEAEAIFDGTVFDRPVHFSGATFAPHRLGLGKASGAWFSDTVFGDEARFDNANFVGGAPPVRNARVTPPKDHNWVRSYHWPPGWRVDPATGLLVGDELPQDQNTNRLIPPN